MSVFTSIRWRERDEVMRLIRGRRGREGGGENEEREREKTPGL